ncbi:MAG: hypothetical protein PWR03_2353 [Tenuifilum sp.]|uniref:hypothetical protein n=1 Tax=Tenuifilum sp. TaxID=2760880 RepID=UPI0024AAA503|nr:hypothetical protein [Tenuifilum sp.]MDI3528169.1 hypothetical protein [Tenuifilum sp.]
MSYIKGWFKTVVLLSMVLIIKPLSSYSQDIKSLREIGNYVQIFYNTLDDYQNGVTLNGYTRVKIKFRVDGSSGWELRVFAQTSTIEHEDGTNSLPLTALELTPAILSTTDPTASVVTPFNPPQGPYNPSDATQVIASGTGGTIGTNPPIEAEFSISYKTGNMVNEIPGLYFVTLQFLLVEY